MKHIKIIVRDGIVEGALAEAETEPVEVEILDILQSLRQDVDAGRLTIGQAAEELCDAGWMNFIDIVRTKKLLYGGAA